MQYKSALFLVHFLTVLTVSAQVSMKKIADLDRKMQESSGLVLYQGQYLLTHNDGGNKSEIFVLDLKGNLVRTINVKNTKNHDWEDLAQDDKGTVYVGDFGNNLNEREECQIYILPKDIIKSDEIEPDKIKFTYEDQHKYPPKKEDLNYDCEAFFWKDDHLYLLTKCRTKPFTGESRVYELEAKKGKQVAKYKGSIYLCQSGWRFCSVTSVDYYPKTNTMAILTYGKLYILSNFIGIEFWNGDIRSYSLPVVKQREAICFAKDGKLYMTDEYRKGFGGGNLYELNYK